MVNAEKESHRQQGDSVFLYEEFSNVEAVPNSKLSSEVRPLVMLQGGHNGYSKVHGGVETKLGGFKGPSEAVGMEYDGDNINDA